MFVLLMTCALALSMTQGADASLMRMTVEGDEVIVDGVNDLMWADLQLFTNMTYAEQQTEIAGLNAGSYAGSSDWNMSSTAPWDEAGVTLQDVATQFLPTYHVGDITTWDGRIDKYWSMSDWRVWTYLSRDDPSGNLIVIVGPVADELAQGDLAAWVSAPYIEPQPTPEPVTMFLFGTGLIALAGFSRKLKE